MSKNVLARWVPVTNRAGAAPHGGSPLPTAGSHELGPNCRECMRVHRDALNSLKGTGERGFGAMLWWRGVIKPMVDKGEGF